MKKTLCLLFAAALSLLAIPTASAQKFEISESVINTISTLPDSLRYSAYEIALNAEKNAFYSEDSPYEIVEDVVLPIVIVVIFFASVVLVVFFIVKSSRKREEGRNAIIDKMVDSGVFASANADTAKLLESLMPHKKSEKEQVIREGALLGVGIGMLLMSFREGFQLDEIFAVVSLILIGYSVLRLAIRAIYKWREKSEEVKSEK